MTTWSIYKHIGHDGELLYVGCTSNLDDRRRTHSTTARWWPRVASVEVVAETSDRSEGLALEADLIRELQPPFNYVHTHNTRPVGQPGLFDPNRPTPTEVEPAVWVLSVTGKTAHAMKDQTRTECGMRREWRRLFVVDPVADEYPCCAACERSLLRHATAKTSVGRLLAQAGPGGRDGQRDQLERTA